MSETFRDRPDLAKELHPTKNAGLTHRDQPIDVLDLACGTNKKLWWLCSTCEHEWFTPGFNRTSKRGGSGCPKCAMQERTFRNRKPMSETHPDLAAEYQGDATKIVAGSHKRVLWKCRTCEHEWKTMAKNRSRNKSGCPVCNHGDLHSDGRNSMAETHPDLAAEYQGDATKLIAGTHKKLLWKCSTCEHEWITTGNTRANGARGCPSCAKYGFQLERPASYYVHEILNSMDDCIYYKGGISCDWKRRLSKLARTLPDGLTIRNLEVIEFEQGQEALDLEKELLQRAAEEGWKAPERSFDGGCELFLCNPLDQWRAGLVTFNKVG